MFFVAAQPYEMKKNEECRYAKPFCSKNNNKFGRADLSIYKGWLVLSKLSFRNAKISPSFRLKLNLNQLKLAQTILPETPESVCVCV